MCRIICLEKCSKLIRISAAGLLRIDRKKGLAAASTTECALRIPPPATGIVVSQKSPCSRNTFILVNISGGHDLSHNVTVSFSSIVKFLKSEEAPCNKIFTYTCNYKVFCGRCGLLIKDITQDKNLCQD